jgi:polysaccharide biosynthesis/export protein PslD
MMTAWAERLGVGAGILALMVVAGGCASSSSDERFAESPIIRVATAPYVIQPNDTLMIKFYHHPEHDLEEVVRPDGKLSLPTGTSVRAAGFTPAQLGVELVKYFPTLRDPKIDVVVKNTEARVYVGGEVFRPGFVAYRTGLTALQAVVEAGGPLDSANLDDIVFLQRMDEEHFRATRINLTEALAKGHTSSMVLGPADVVFVPKSGIAKANDWVTQYIVNMLPVRASMGVSAAPGQ